VNIFSHLWNRFAESVSIRTYRRIYFSMQKDALQQQALHSQVPGTDPAFLLHNRELIVSLTTHGKRLSDAWLPIECIMQGTLLPSNIILWLDEERQKEPLPIIIQKQIERGLQVRYIRDIGPYTKLVPSLQQYPEATIVTIDDDMFYPYDMLESLVAASKQYPEAICANRVVVMEKDSKGKYTPLRTWRQTERYGQTSENYFFEAVAGVLYPHHSLAPEFSEVGLFKQLCPIADDIWFNAMARKQQTKIIAVNEHNELPFLWVNESMQSDALHLKNNNPKSPLNDIQFNRVWSYFKL